jgi:hypothetical protein
MGFLVGLIVGIILGAVVMTGFFVFSDEPPEVG